jgi:class 3 adenylate cyclase
MDTPRIQYAKTSDGIDIAYAVIGTGPPLLVLRQYMALDVHADITQDPRWLPPGLGLADTRSLVIWDYRGTGLSGPGVTQTVESALLDMQAVAEDIGLTKFDLLGMMTPAHHAVAYAARHPERVNRMVLWNPGRVGTSMRSVWEDLGVPDITTTHFREYADLAGLRVFGWERADRAQRFADLLFQRYTSETWAQFNASIEAIDATGLASSVKAPCLVIIDLNVPNQMLVGPVRQQFMRQLAAAIPNARLTIIKSGEPGDYVAQIHELLGMGADPAPDDALPSGTAIVLFIDIVDSTALTERLGDTTFRDKARDAAAALRAIIAENGGKTIEGPTLGDGVLAVFTSARQAIEAALACAKTGDEGGLPVHVGVHAGDVLREQDPDGRSNVYGGAVNIASRISGLSAPGEVLVSETVRSLARTSTGVRFEDRGEQALKGVSEAVRVWAVV